MYRILRSMLMLSLVSSPTLALPTAGCLDYEHCPTGYYCETALRLCRQCLRCEDLGRREPLEDTCVKSVAQCGDCLEGLVLSSTTNRCSPREERRLPPYLWAGLAVAALLAIGIFIFAVHVFKKKEGFKSACIATQSTLERVSSPGEASAPPALAPPPPYNEVMALSPSHCEEMSPFIKPVTPNLPRHGPAESQTACVFNRPDYERTIHPPSYDRPIVLQPLSTIQEGVPDTSSDQTHSTHSASEEEAHSPNSPAAAQHLAKPAEPKQRTNNNNKREGAPNANPPDDSRQRGADSCAAVVVTIINTNSLQQQNHLT